MSGAEPRLMGEPWPSARRIERYVFNESPQTIVALANDPPAIVTLQLPKP